MLFSAITTPVRKACSKYRPHPLLASPLKWVGLYRDPSLGFISGPSGAIDAPVGRSAAPPSPSPAAPSRARRTKATTGPLQRTRSLTDRKLHRAGSLNPIPAHKPVNASAIAREQARRMRNSPVKPSREDQIFLKEMKRLGQHQEFHDALQKAREVAANAINLEERTEHRKAEILKAREEVKKAELAGHHAGYSANPQTPKSGHRQDKPRATAGGSPSPFCSAPFRQGQPIKFPFGTPSPVKPKFFEPFPPFPSTPKRPDPAIRNLFGNAPRFPTSPPKPSASPFGRASPYTRPTPKARARDPFRPTAPIIADVKNPPPDYPFDKDTTERIRQIGIKAQNSIKRRCAQEKLRETIRRYQEDNARVAAEKAAAPRIAVINFENNMRRMRLEAEEARRQREQEAYEAELRERADYLRRKMEREAKEAEEHRRQQEQEALEAQARARAAQALKEEEDLKERLRKTLEQEMKFWNELNARIEKERIRQQELRRYYSEWRKAQAPPPREPSNVDMDLDGESFYRSHPNLQAPPREEYAEPPIPKEFEVPPPDKANDANVRRCYEVYQAKWKELQTVPDHSIRFASFPWPVLAQSVPTLDGLTHTGIMDFFANRACPRSADKSLKKRIKPELLHWHPDKFNAKYGRKLHPADAEAIIQGVGFVVRYLVELNSTLVA